MSELHEFALHTANYTNQIGKEIYPVKPWNKYSKRTAFSDTERKLFFGVDEDGKWINIIVHPVACEPVNQ
jgi:hypothetical protein